jgi:hypothetical protein
VNSFLLPLGLYVPPFEKNSVSHSYSVSVRQFVFLYRHILFKDSLRLSHPQSSPANHSTAFFIPVASVIFSMVSPNPSLGCCFFQSLYSLDLNNIPCFSPLVIFFRNPHLYSLQNPLHNYLLIFVCSI